MIIIIIIFQVGPGELHQADVEPALDPAIRRGLGELARGGQQPPLRRDQALHPGADRGGRAGHGAAPSIIIIIIIIIISAVPVPQLQRGTLAPAAGAGVGGAVLTRATPLAETGEVDT